MKRFIASILLVCLMCANTNITAFAAQPAVGDVHRGTNDGTARGSMYKVEIKSVAASGSTETETYMASLYGKWDVNNFTQSSAMNSIFITEAGIGYLTANEYYVYGSNASVLVTDRCFLGASMPKTYGNFTTLNNELMSVCAQITSGAPLVQMAGNTDSISAGNKLFGMISEGIFDDYVKGISTLVAGNTSFSSEVFYGAVLVSLYAASGSRLNSSAIEEYLVSYNRDGSSSYVFVEINDLVSMRNESKTECWNYTYHTAFATVFGMAPEDFANIPLSGTVSGTTEYKQHYVNSIKNLVGTRGIVKNIGTTSMTMFFGNFPKGNGSWGTGTAWDRSLVCIQVDSNTGLSSGQPSSTYYSRTSFGPPVTVSTKGNVYLSASPKNSVWTGGTVSATLNVNAICNSVAEKQEMLAQYKSGAKLVFTFSSTDVSGSATDGTGKIVDSASRGSRSGNTVTVTLSSVDEFEKWLNGDRTLTVTDSGITPADTGVKRYYNVSLSINTGTNTYTAMSRGVEGIGTTTAKDWASWIGPNPILEYHSASGQETAYAEIKNNAPNTEDWEAMAGVPTTENLYVTAGGQMWQVDVTGQLKTNAATTRKVTIRVTVNDCWGDDAKCSPVCNGHPWVVCPGGVAYGVAPVDPVTGIPGERPTCGGSSGVASGTGQTISWSGSCVCGASNSGTFTHSMGPSTHEDNWLSGGWGDTCSNTTNHTHRQSCTYTFTINLPIDSFTYYDMVGLDTNYLSKMTFTGNSSLFNNPNGTKNNNKEITNYFNQNAYASGNGRLYFDLAQNVLSVYGNSINQWGDVTINVSAVAGSNSVNGTHTGGNGYPGALHTDCQQTAIACANDVLRQLQGKSYTAVIVSDYAEIESAGKYQTIAYYEQNSVPANWFDGLTFTAVNQTLTCSNKITWSYTATEDQVWYSNPYRTLKGVNDVGHTGYNGNFTQVSYGTMSGKFQNTGTYAESRYNLWCLQRSQPNAVCKVFNESVNDAVPLTVKGIDIKDTYKNGQVTTGNCTITYADGVTIGSPGNGGNNRNGTYTCKYSPNDTKINDIVVHDPVSVQYSEVLSNPDSMDQRVNSDEILMGGDNGENLIDGNQTGATIQDGIAFINIGASFTVRLSNKGDFAEQPTLLGIATCTEVRGKGFTDNMDCTKWTEHRYLILPVHVTCTLKDGTKETYMAGDYIDTSELMLKEGTTDEYEFICLSNNDEAVKSKVQFISTAINAQRDGYHDESNGVTNKLRVGNRAAKHTATKNQTIDVVGLIGNLTINDTGDFRFAELFKQPKTNGSWLIPNLVREVDYRRPNQIASDPLDILMNEANASTNYHSTFGITYSNSGGKAYPFVTLPLTPSDNPIVELQNQEMRPGYNLYMDIETIGNYYGENFDEYGNARHNNLFQRMVIKPRYWSYNLDTGVYTPVDVYYGYEGNYQIIVPFDSDDTTYKSEWLYYLNWGEESARRNYVNLEKTNTELVISKYSEWLRTEIEDFDGIDGYTYAPDIEGVIQSKDRIGTANTLFLDSQNRTFIGSSELYGEEQVAGTWLNNKENSVFQDAFFGRQSQRWHFTLGLPSSAVFVKQGQACTKANIDALAETNSVIVCALDIKVQGEIWALEYDGSAVNFSDGTGYEIYPGETVLPPKEDTDGDGDIDENDDYIDDPIVVVYNNRYTSEDDLRTEGTH